mgnify:CR=1 FL=1
MRRVALRAVRAHLVKFALSLLAVALGVAFVSGTFSLRTMMSATFDELVSGTTVAQTYVRAAEGQTQLVTDVGGPGPERVPITLVTELAAVEGVDVVLPELTGGVVLVGADGTAVSSGGAPSFGFAFFPEEPAQEVVAGRAPQGAHEIALESTTLATSGLVIGDETRIVVGGEIVPVTVVGEIAGFGPVAGATITLFDAEVAERLFAPDGLVPTIAVYSSLAEEQVTARVAAALPEGVEAITGADRRDETSAQIEEELGFVETFLLVFAAIALFVGAFIISNTFAMDIRQRQRELAMLRAVGASPTQVFTSVLTQAAVVGLVGSALGVLGGFGLVTLVRAVFAQIGMELSGRIPLEAQGVLTALVLGTLVSLAAAVLPARRAASTRPVEAMREETVEVERSLELRGLLGSALTALGAGAVLTAALSEASWVEDVREPMLGAGAGAVVVGVLVLAPVLARAVLRIVSAPFVRAVRPAGRLAQGNVLRNPRRTASTASALVIGMALVGAAAVIAASTTASTRAIVESDFTADFIVTTPTQIMPDGAERAIAQVAGVGSTDPVWGSWVELADDDVVSVAGIDPLVVGRSLEIEATQGSMTTLAEGGAAVRESLAEEKGWRVGDEITLASELGEVTVRVGALQDSRAIDSAILLGHEVFDEVASPASTVLAVVMVNAGEGTDLETLRAGLTSAIEPFAVLSLMDAEEFAGWLAAQVEQILVILYALLGLSIVIAVLGIVNTLALSVIERTREIGLLRAVGLGRTQLAGTVTIESVLVAVFGTALGVAVGVALASAMPSVFAEEGLSVLSVPASSLAAMLGLAVVVGVLAALWPATRAARLPVLDAVSYE